MRMQVIYTIYIESTRNPWQTCVGAWLHTFVFPSAEMCRVDRKPRPTRYTLWNAYTFVWRERGQSCKGTLVQSCALMPQERFWPLEFSTLTQRCIKGWLIFADICSLSERKLPRGWVQGEAANDGNATAAEPDEPADPAESTEDSHQWLLSLHNEGFAMFVPSVKFKNLFNPSWFIAIQWWPRCY